ncbi:MAG: hypothetical protein CM15mP126_4500 [Gammaproteobacteria bacterium]|nr:MAG: hypothetical protein CM15mP126_4500 [Gammaproteobacteria bacterium]
MSATLRPRGSVDDCDFAGINSSSFDGNSPNTNKSSICLPSLIIFPFAVLLG